MRGEVLSIPSYRLPYCALAYILRMSYPFIIFLLEKNENACKDGCDPRRKDVCIVQAGFFIHRPDIRRELQDKRTWDWKIVTMFPEIPVKISCGTAPAR